MKPFILVFCAFCFITGLTGCTEKSSHSQAQSDSQLQPGNQLAAATEGDNYQGTSDYKRCLAEAEDACRKKHFSAAGIFLSFAGQSQFAPCYRGKKQTCAEQFLPKQ